MARSSEGGSGGRQDVGPTEAGGGRRAVRAGEEGVQRVGHASRAWASRGRGEMGRAKGE
jgi:hypothetical protein